MAYLLVQLLISESIQKLILSCRLPNSSVQWKSVHAFFTMEVLAGSALQYRGGHDGGAIVHGVRGGRVDGLWWDGLHATTSGVDAACSGGRPPTDDEVPSGRRIGVVGTGFVARHFVRELRRPDWSLRAGLAAAAVNASLGSGDRRNRWAMDDRSGRRAVGERPGRSADRGRRSARLTWAASARSMRGRRAILPVVSRVAPQARQAVERPTRPCECVARTAVARRRDGRFSNPRRDSGGSVDRHRPRWVHVVAGVLEPHRALQQVTGVQGGPGP